MYTVFYPKAWCDYKSDGDASESCFCSVRISCCLQRTIELLN